MKSNVFFENVLRSAVKGASREAGASLLTASSFEVIYLRSWSLKEWDPGNWRSDAVSRKSSPGPKCREFTYTQNGDKGINRSVEHSVPIQLCLLHALWALKHGKVIPEKKSENVLTLRMGKKARLSLLNALFLLNSACSTHCEPWIMKRSPRKKCREFA